MGRQKKVITLVEFIYCGCGCGKTTAKYSGYRLRKFINHHSRRGKTLSIEHKQKLRIAHTGKKHTEEHRRKVGLASKRNHDQFHPAWKGDDAGYVAIHTWIRKNLPKQNLCQICNQLPPHDVACITGIYNRDFINWMRLCRKCHMIQDGRLKPTIN